MDEEIRMLEDELLALEEQFSRNIPIDVADFIGKTKKLTALQVSQAREEGLKAGLVVKEIKEKRKEQEASSTSQEQIPRDPFLQTKPTQEPFTQGQMPQEPYQHGQIPQGQLKNLFTPPAFQAPPVFQVPPTIPPILKDKIPSKTALSELNLGKYVMGVLAAILALTGTIVLGALVWNDLSNGVKALGLLLLASVMTFVPFRHIMLKKERQSNGFFNSLMGAGLSIYYITTIFMGTSWGFFGETTLLLALVGLILLTVLISYHVQSNTLLLVSFIGNFFTMCLLASKPMTIATLQIALVLLLATFLFLLAFTMKNTWTTGLTKGASLIFALGMVFLTHQNIYQTNRQMSSLVSKYYLMESPLFSTYVISVFFTLIVALVIGACLSRSDNLSLGIFSVSPHGIGLFFTYWLLAGCHYHYSWLFLLMILCTFLLSNDKSTATMISIPFVIFGLYELSEDLGRWESFPAAESVYFYVFLCSLAFFIHFSSKWTENKRCAFASFTYAFFAFGVIASGLDQSILFAVPIIILLVCYFLEGYQKALGTGTLPVIYLCAYLPLALLCAIAFYEIYPKPSSVEYYYAPFILIFAGVITVAGRYFINLSENQKFQLVLRFSKIISFFYVCGRLNHGRRGSLDLIFFETIALLFFMGELFYLVLSPEPPYLKRKAVPLLFILWGVISWTKISVLGDFSYTSSILILLMGCLSIFLGFRQKEVELRHLGLGLSILAVLKMVTVDIGSGDSITRVIALIVGAVLCFLISCVYNRLPVAMGLETEALPKTEDTENPDKGNDML
ncbi:MAG: hypothetical protein R3Y63_05170 [Eubacteriales bacterium]